MEASHLLMRISWNLRKVRIQKKIRWINHRLAMINHQYRINQTNLFAIIVNPLRKYWTANKLYLISIVVKRKKKKKSFNTYNKTYKTCLYTKFRWPKIKLKGFIYAKVKTISLFQVLSILIMTLHVWVILVILICVLLSLILRIELSMW